jgi:hypothetical protein
VTTQSWIIALAVSAILGAYVGGTLVAFAVDLVTERRRKRARARRTGGTMATRGYDYPRLPARSDPPTQIMPAGTYDAPADGSPSMSRRVGTGGDW